MTPDHVDWRVEEGVDKGWRVGKGVDEGYFFVFSFCMDDIDNRCASIGPQIEVLIT